MANYSEHLQSCYLVKCWNCNCNALVKDLKYEKEIVEAVADKSEASLGLINTKTEQNILYSYKGTNYIIIGTSEDDKNDSFLLTLHSDSLNSYCKRINLDVAIDNVNIFSNLQDLFAILNNKAASDELEVIEVEESYPFSVIRCSFAI